MGLVLGGLIGYPLGRRSGDARSPRVKSLSRTDAAWNDPQLWGYEAERMFNQVRSRAGRELRRAKRRGLPLYLASFDDVVGGRVLNRVDRGITTVPIEDIVGSVDKPRQFTPSFNPTEDAMKERWKRIYGVTHGLLGYQPVDLYLVDDDYYVLDGHYRISVVRALGGEAIRAHVEEWV